MRAAIAYFIELLILIAALATIGTFMVPCHWTSIWADREFTGWVAPVARRLAEGQVLYDTGAHSPLAPLPFVLLEFLFGRQANWFSESLVNFVCQGLTIITLYISASFYFRRPIAFLAAVGTIPTFFSLQKTILYDAQAQLLVAAVAAAATAYVVALSRHLVDTDRTAPRSSIREIAALVCLAVASAGCILSKQNTGVGATLGAGCAVLLLPRADGTGRRCRRAAMYLALVALAGATFCALLSRTISIPGFVWDVALTGSEPKGGPLTMLANFRNYAGELLWTFFPLVFTGLILWAAVAPRVTDSGANAPAGETVSTGIRSVQRSARWQLLWAAAGCLGAVLGLRTLLSLPPNLPGFPGSSPMLGLLPIHFLNTALLVSLVVTWRVIRQGTPHHLEGHLYTLAPLMLVTLPAALFHSLSTPTFRWTYDDNPLVFVALTALFALVLSVRDAWRPGKRWLWTAGVAGLCCVIEMALWSEANAGRKIAVVRECTQTWPEVRYLAGAKLPLHAAGMRAVVRVVRELAQPDDTVLLLPNDPNVEAWFERPRPHLSSAIIFVDQYWDRYVDADFAELQRHPPKVIIIGPRSFWLMFQLAWHGNSGAARLIQRVIRELLPTAYEPSREQAITFRDKPDFMDVYVRRDRAPGVADVVSPNAIRLSTSRKGHSKSFSQLAVAVLTVGDMREESIKSVFRAPTASGSSRRSGQSRIEKAGRI